MVKINEKLSSHEKYKYDIKESNYMEYVKINGTKMVNKPIGLAIRNNNARYYIIEKDGIFLDDFCVYNENNLIAINKKYLFNEALLNMIINILKNNYEFIMLHNPIENTNDFDRINEIFEERMIEEVKQGNYMYQQILIKI